MACRWVRSNLHSFGGFMIVRSGSTIIAATLLLVAPSIARAQLPNSAQTSGAKTKDTEAQVCAADYEQSVKPIENWQRSEALRRYGRRDDYQGTIDHLIPVSLGGS